MPADVPIEADIMLTELFVRSRLRARSAVRTNRWSRPTASHRLAAFVFHGERPAHQPVADPKTVMIDATYLKAHRTASSLRVKKGASAA